MLHAPVTDTKNKTKSTNFATLAEHEQQNQIINWLGRSLQRSTTSVERSFSIGDFGNLVMMQQAYGNQAALRRLRTEKGRSLSINPTQGCVLQRKCACGSASGAGGACAECQENQGRSLQTKLRISEPGDEYEQEADRIAEQVVQMPDLCFQHKIESANANEGIVQIKETPEAVSPSSDQFFSKISPIAKEDLKSLGQPLDPETHTFMESRFAYNFNDVRIHTDSEADVMAHSINAQAFTHKRDIYFASGAYDPKSEPGRRLIAHELTHTIQQTGTQSNVIQRQEHEEEIPEGEQQATMNRPVSHSMQSSDSPPSSATASGRPVYICTKPILGSMLHGQGHAFFRVGSPRPGNPTYELEHARSCYCGWQGWPRRDVPEDRNADVPCVLTSINESCLTGNWNSYPVGKYCARGPNSNTYVRVISARCGSTTRPPGNVAGYDESPPSSGGAGAPHPYLSVIGCFDVDCDDTECGIIPGINHDITPGVDPEG